MSSRKMRIRWWPKENDFGIFWEKDYSSNASFIADHICDKEFIKELERRGYDLKTLKFEITKKEG